MNNTVPVIARMIIISDYNVNEKKQEDISYYNTKYDSECEYCQNTSSWD